MLKAKPCPVCGDPTTIYGLCWLHLEDFMRGPEGARVRSAIADWARRVDGELQNGEGPSRPITRFNGVTK